MDLMTRNGINMYSTYSDKKASVVERFNRTLKTLMWKQFTLQGSYKWTPILDRIVTEYNDRVHSSINMKPSEVTERDEPALRRTSPKISRKRPKYKVGDNVRVSTYKKMFDKGYLQNWTNEIFKIATVQKTDPVTYLLRDLTGEEVKGGFYEQELQGTRVPDLFLVEKVIRKRKAKDGKLEYYVKWKGCDSKHNSWTNDIKSLSST
jgi:hypothetical protein